MWKLIRCLALLSALFGGSARATEAPKPYFSLHDLGHGVWSAIAVPGMHAGGNTGFVVGDDGVLVVDTFDPPEATRALIEAIHRVTPKPIRYVVDTHYHMDHLAGNGLFQQEGAVILAQRNVRAWARTENNRIMPPPITTEQAARIANLTLPSLVYADGAEVYLGDKKVILRVMPGHTGGDTVVVVPDAGVVFTGDLYWDHALPNLVDADTRAQIATLETLARDYPDAAFVPGHGKFVPEPELGRWPMARAQDLLGLRDYLKALRAAVSAALAAGKSGQALQDAVLPQLKRDFGGLFAFDYFAAKNIAQTEAELTGQKQIPRPLH